MLSIEFYLLNATTVLLWLFQTFSHEVLLLLLLLGAVCVLVSLHVTVFSLVKFMLSLVLELVWIVLARLPHQLLSNSPLSHLYHPQQLAKRLPSLQVEQLAETHLSPRHLMASRLPSDRPHHHLRRQPLRGKICYKIRNHARPWKSGINAFGSL